MKTNPSQMKGSVLDNPPRKKDYEPAFNSFLSAAHPAKGVLQSRNN
jgi:hypothetical protein